MAIFGLIRCCRDPGWSGINATARFLSGHHGPKNWNSWPPHIWWIIFLWQCDDANVHRMQTASTMLSSSSLVPYPSLKVYWGSSIRRFVNKQFTWNWHRDGRIFVFLLATAWWCWSGIQEKGIGYSDISGLETAWCYLEYQAKCNIQVAREIGTCWWDWLATYQDWEVEKECRWWEHNKLLHGVGSGTQVGQRHNAIVGISVEPLVVIEGLRPAAQLKFTPNLFIHVFWRSLHILTEYFQSEASNVSSFMKFCQKSLESLFNYCSRFLFRWFTECLRAELQGCCRQRCRCLHLPYQYSRPPSPSTLPSFVRLMEIFQS